MAWGPEKGHEKQDKELKALLDIMVEKMGPEKYQEFADKFILSVEDLLMEVGTPDNPAVIRLKELQAKHDNGFE